MTTAKDIADNLISRAKSMQTFHVVRQLDDPDIIFSAGRVPFDLKMTREGLMTVTVHAMTSKEAESLVDAWLTSLEQGDNECF